MYIRSCIYKNLRIETIISYIVDIMAVDNRLSKKSISSPLMQTLNTNQVRYVLMIFLGRILK